MGADISRATFDPVKHYSSVRQQQGRVSVDADWNEQVEITAHRIQTGTADLIGRTGAPRDNAGFLLRPLPLTGASKDIAILPGHMYVDGILCELESSVQPIVKINGITIQLGNMVPDGWEFQPGQWVEISGNDNTAMQTQITAVTVSAQTLTVADDASSFASKATQLQRITTYFAQPDYLVPAPLPSNGLGLVYLDVWERTITALEDGHIRDSALGPAIGSDPTTRTKTVWQVKVAPIPNGSTCATAPDITTLVPQSTGQLLARSESTGAPSACILPPRAGYRRLQNQSYLVQVYTAGNLTNQKPTFTWSREAASVFAAIVQPAPVLSANTSLTLNVNSLGRDQVLGFAAGQWVELTDDGRELAGLPGILVQLTGAAQGPQGPVLTADATVANPADVNGFVTGFNSLRNPKVRRWEQSGAQVSTNTPGGDVLIQEGTPIDLESGVQITFAPGGNYVTGDYWLIPARTVTGDVDWPHDSAGNPLFRPPNGIRHHYCQLGIVNFGPLVNNPGVWSSTDCRQLFAPAADGGIRIQSIFMSVPTSVSPNQGVVSNDGTVALQDLSNGISIACDTPIDPFSLNSNPTLNPHLVKPTCFVTIDVPALEKSGLPPFGFQPTVVSADVKVDLAGTTILWAPTTSAQSWITDVLRPILAASQTPPPTILAHLTLKGGFIWALGDPSVHLDGQTFGLPGTPDANGNQPTVLRAPIGNGRAGSDFDMWFWLISLPGLVAIPANFDFGDQAVNTKTTAVITVTNNSGASATVTVALDNTTDFSETNTLQNPLANNASFTITVTFTPSAAGLRSGTLKITPTPGTELDIPLSGTGTSGSLQAVPASMVFSAIVGSDSDSRSVVISNIGSANVAILGAQVTGTAAADYAHSGIARGLAPGQSMTVDVSFTPSVKGTRLASLELTHSAPGSPLTIPLNGTGRAPVVLGGGSGLQGGGLGRGKLQAPKQA